MYKIAVVAGSLRKDSINKKLALALEKTGAGLFDMVRVPIDDIPLYNGDLESPMPAPVLRFKEQIVKSDGVLFVTPEYNRSIPGVLKNVLDWASRPYGESVWGGKPAATCGASIGAIGTAVAQSHLRSVLVYFNMPVMGQPEVYFADKPGLITDDGTVTDEKTVAFLRNFLESFREFVEQHR